MPFGGPDGGDGGLGGSVYLKAVEGMNTLADFRISRIYKGQNGESGSGNDCTGHGGDDVYVPVPVGTVISDVETGEQLGDLMADGQTLAGGQGRQGRLGQHAVQVEHQSHPAQVRARACRARSASSRSS